MPKHLHIDIETYSSGDLKNGGVHVYTESPDFEILLIAYCFDDEPIQLISLAEGEEMPGEFIHGLKDKNVLKFAHNATFERLCFRAVGFDVPPDQWRCTAVWSSYCGYPLGLDAATKAMGVTEKNLKDNRGKALIRYFCIPCKPTKTNGGRLRNMWHHDQARWSEFKEYCIQDVVAEKAICKHLASYPMPRTEWQNYTIDQLINDRGVMIDREFCKNAIAIDTENRKRIIDKQKQITGLDNPNSLGQLKEWLTDQLGKEIQSLAADKLNTLIEEVEPGPVRDVLSLRKRGSRTSVMKYSKMITCANLDGRARGLFQFYGAGKTGRWAGRRVQPQNLPRTFLKPLDQYRDHFKNNNLDVLDLMYGKTSETLAQLIRTAIIPAPGKVLGVADFSSIEARVLAWLSGESWKLEVFNTHGKIYEAVAANMFNVPIDEVTKGSDLRARGKVAELALGYQGSTGALKTMGAERMGLDETEMSEIVDKWRKASPATCNFWYEVDHYFKNAMSSPNRRQTLDLIHTRLNFIYDGNHIRIGLPSGRELHYPRPEWCVNRWGKRAVRYWGLDQVKRKWTPIETYGGKLTENLCQAIARDLLANSLKNLHAAGFKTVMHVHDEAGAELDHADELDAMIDAMMILPKWAKGLPFDADGYTSEFYKKD